MPSVFFPPLWARPLLRPSRLYGVLRALLWLAFSLWLLFAATITVSRFFFLPTLAKHVIAVEESATHFIGMPVKIGKISAAWQGLNPALQLEEVILLDEEGDPAFSIARVDAVFSWKSLWRVFAHGQPVFSLLRFDGIALQVQREMDGRFRVAGLFAKAEEGNKDWLDWLLAQQHIAIVNSRVVWEDRLHHKMPVTLQSVQIQLFNEGSRHRFGMVATPPPHLAATLDFRGDITGDDFSTFSDGRAQFFLEMPYADLAAWREHLNDFVALPLQIKKGVGAMRLWFEIDDKKTWVTSDVALQALDLYWQQGKNALPTLPLSMLRGRLQGGLQLKADRTADRWWVRVKKLELQTEKDAGGNKALRLPPADWSIEGRALSAEDSVNTALVVAMEQVDLVALRALSKHFLMPDESRTILQRFAPTGWLYDVKASFQLAENQETPYALKARFQNLGWQADGAVPGASGLTGAIDFNEKKGTLNIDSSNASLALPLVFSKDALPSLPFSELKAAVKWNKEAAATKIQIDKLRFSNADATGGEVRGYYRYTDEGPGEIDIEGRIAKAKGSAVWKYLPLVVEKEVRDWLKEALVAADGYDGRLVLRGDLRNFPFRDPAKGSFFITAKAEKGKLRYVPDWPLIDDVAADLRFGVGMKIEGRRGRIFDALLDQVVVEIPDFESFDERLLISGGAKGETQDFLRFIEKSPLSMKIGHFTEGMKSKGKGALNLRLDMPLRDLSRTTLAGDYGFSENEITVLDALPPIQGAKGSFHFDEKNVLAEKIQGRIFGGQLSADVKNKAGKVFVTAEGLADAALIAAYFDLPKNLVQGSTPWQTEVSVAGKAVEVAIQSTLEGAQIALPPPFEKAAAAKWPFRLTQNMSSEKIATQIRWHSGEKPLLSAQMLWRHKKIEQGAVVIGEGDAVLPDRGFNLFGSAEKVDIDHWRSLLQGYLKARVSDSLWQEIRLKTPLLQFSGKTLHHSDIRLYPLAKEGAALEIQSDEIAGNLRWTAPNDRYTRGFLEGELQKLYWPVAAKEAAKKPPQNTANSLQAKDFPAAHLKINDLQFGEKKLGSLEINASEDTGLWRVDHLLISNPDGKLVGKGFWRSTPEPLVRLDFAMESSDTGKLLSRLGYVGTLKQGTTKLEGFTQWKGSIFDIDYPTLSGEIQLQAANGQFEKLKPGVGKLLGLLSLQALPQRLTLDFKDIFSDGLAFRQIEGKLKIKEGILQTDTPLEIFAPAAKIEITGKTRLEEEDQQLLVVVTPETGILTAAGLALINPVVGVVSLLASSIGKNPISKLLSYRYQVTGTWSDPKIEQQSVQKNFSPPAGSIVEDLEKIRATQEVPEPMSKEKPEEKP